MRNRAMCPECKTIIESTYRHDFVMCPCANRAFVDGGNDYHRWGYVNTPLVYVDDDDNPIDPDWDEDV